MFVYISVGMVLNADEKKAKGQFKKDDLISELNENLINNKAYGESCQYIIEGDMSVKKIEIYLEWNTSRVPKKI